MDRYLSWLIERRRKIVRAMLLSVILLSGASVANAFVSHSDSDVTIASDGQPTVSSDTDPSEITVVSSQSGRLFAFDRAGKTVWESHRRGFSDTFDVDPIVGSRYSVIYVGVRSLSKENCPQEAVVFDCRENLIVRANLSTGESDVLYSEVSRGKWHDVDRVEGDRFLIADNGMDTVKIVDASSKTVVWAWNARADYPITAGGDYPHDWTHINDVELLEDGRVMVSLRNFDEVAFLDRQVGLRENETLGTTNEHSVLFEQHNPDYIPASEGGPAVVVADSENHRVKEFQRRNGEWELAWEWTGARVQWPRDADRLPSGHTLVTDSHGGRVIEVDRNGEVVWSVEVDIPYEAERLHTGDESRGGESATRLALESRTDDSTATGESDASTQSTKAKIYLAVKNSLPGPLFNAARWLLPPWYTISDVVNTAVLTASLLVWITVEVWWSPLGITWRRVDSDGDVPRSSE